MRVVESIARWVVSEPQNAAYSDGSDQQNTGDKNPQGSSSDDSHGLADFHLRRLIPCRRKQMTGILDIYGIPESRPITA